jgi:hypothetical protein
MATSMSQARPNYWFFFLPFTTCALLGIAGGGLATTAWQ